MTNPSFTRVDRFLEHLAASGGYPNSRNARFFLQQLFAGVPLDGARVLDVGGGNGFLSFWAALHGARDVVCLEPEGAGATRGIAEQFKQLATTLSLPARLEQSTLQEHLLREPDTFDVVLMHNVVNHLDEPACMRLHRDPGARAVYAGVFQALARHVAPGGRLMIADCARHNLWPAIGVTNPFMRTIEWHKHQDPETWTALLRDAGWRRRSLRWSSFNSLGHTGRRLLGNRAGAFLTLGHFVAWYEKEVTA